MKLIINAFYCNFRNKWDFVNTKFDMGMGDQMSRTSSIIVITIRVQEQVFVTVAQEDFAK